MKGMRRYLAESFSASLDSFDKMFSDFLNTKYSSGWKVKGCEYHTEGDHRIAHCVFRTG